MLRTLPQTRTHTLPLRLAWVALFLVLTIVSAKFSIEIGAVPITAQVLVVLLSGMVLGARDGALTQITYVSLIAIGLPFDARGLGTAALFGPTGGFLLGFAAAAFVAGYLVERASRDKGSRLWMRWLAGLVGVAVIYVCGASHLMLYTGMDAGAAWAAGVAPFIGVDIVKALIAAGLVETLNANLRK